MRPDFSTAAQPLVNLIGQRTTQNAEDVMQTLDLPRHTRDDILRVRGRSVSQVTISVPEFVDELVEARRQTARIRPHQGAKSCLIRAVGIVPGAQIPFDGGKRTDDAVAGRVQVRNVAVIEDVEAGDDCIADV